MNNWYVRLKGNAFELERLAENFSSEDICVELEDGEQMQYILRSKAFSELSEAQAVLSKAKEIIEILNGIGNLTINYYNNIESDTVVGLGKDGSKQVNVFISAGVAIGRSWATGNAVVVRNGEVVEEVAENGLSIQEKWIKLSQTDKNVRTVIGLLTYGIENWVNLYRIFEIIEGDLGMKISDKGWVSKKQRELFKHTANSPSVLGEHSRHGWTTQTPPVSPMELSEAKAMIQSSLIKWFNEKLP